MSVPVLNIKIPYKERNIVMITKIVITGGPCAGKSTAIRHIQKTKPFEKMGYTVICIPEAATTLFSQNITPKTCGSLKTYQAIQFRLQLENERTAFNIAQMLPNKNVLIICDRGIFDGKAYINQNDFNDIVEHYAKIYSHKVSEEFLLNDYHAVFHMLTAAKTQETYQCTDNPARSETAKQAIDLDDKLLQVYENHAHRYIIGDFKTKNQKINTLIDSIKVFLKTEENSLPF